jgi:hypothetical protein
MKPSFAKTLLNLQFCYELKSVVKQWQRFVTSFSVILASAQGEGGIGW